MGNQAICNTSRVTAISLMIEHPSGFRGSRRRSKNPNNCSKVLHKYCDKNLKLVSVSQSKRTVWFWVNVKSTKQAKDADQHTPLNCSRLHTETEGDAFIPVFFSHVHTGHGHLINKACCLHVTLDAKHRQQHWLIFYFNKISPPALHLHVSASQTNWRKNCNVGIQPKCFC